MTAFILYLCKYAAVASMIGLLIRPDPRLSGIAAAALWIYLLSGVCAVLTLWVVTVLVTEPENSKYETALKVARDLTKPRSVFARIELLASSVALVMLAAASGFTCTAVALVVVIAFIFTSVRELRKKLTELDLRDLTAAKLSKQ